MNKCGDCNYCCDKMGFTQKNTYTQNHPDIVASRFVIEQEDIKYEYGDIPCNKLCSKTGECTIYNNRPLVCEKFECAWLQFELDEKYHPKKCGFVAEWDYWQDVINILPEDPDQDVHYFYEKYKLDIEDVVDEICFEMKRHFNKYTISTSKKQLEISR